MIYSTEDAACVKKTWEKVCKEEGLTDFGTRVFERLLSSHPELIPLFSYSAGCSTCEEVKTKKTPGLRQHSTQVMRKLDDCFRGCSNISGMTKELEELGVRHRTYSVQGRQIALLEEPFMETLAEVLGDEFNGEARQSWQRVYANITDALSQGISG